MYQDYIDAVDRAINTLCDVFEQHPTWFFTENDLVCYFYSILLRELPATSCLDCNDQECLLAHREYPTPFRCSMSGDEFRVKKETDRTPRGGKYRRGHYDVVVLNPGFIRQFPYELIKAQDYTDFRESVLPVVKGPPVLYGIEFAYSRAPLKLGGVKVFAKEATKDHLKLRASKIIEFDGKETEFMRTIKSLVFVKGSDESACEKLRVELREMEGSLEARLCFAA